MNHIKLIEQMLEALEAGYHDTYPYVLKCKLAIDAIKEHLK